MDDGVVGAEGVRRARVLVVEDDPGVRAAVSEALALGGFDVAQAADGVEGLERFERDRPDLVVTDVHMPRLRGVDLLRRVREIDPAAPVVLVTGYATLDSAVAAMKDGASDFLMKPLRVGRLIAAVEGLLAASLPAPRPERASAPPSGRARSDGVRLRRWSGGISPERAFAGTVSLRDGSLGLYAGEGRGEGRGALLASSLAADAVGSLAGRVREPGRVLALAGRAIGEALEGSGCVSCAPIAAALGWIDPERRRLSLSSAGLDGALLASPARASVERLAASGPTLRLGEEGDYPRAERRLEVGDLVLLATPSLIALLGEDEAGLEAFVAANLQGGAETVVAAVQELVAMRSGAAPATGAALVAVEITA